MRYVIVGSGVAGVMAAQSIARSTSDVELYVLNEEPRPYYRRPRLLELIAGQIGQDEVYFRPPSWYAGQGIELYLGVSAVALDPAARSVSLSDGTIVKYDRLLLTTGGRPFVPPIPGADREGVFTLRTLDDALAIRERARVVSTAAVIGGGLLGLETARALLSLGLHVSVIEFSPYLLPRQLDVEGARLLQSLLEAQGLRILTGAVTEAIVDGRVRIKGGEAVDGELVIISTGIRSRVELARAAGLKVGRGVVVDEYMRTDGPDIYAAGDVAEFRGRVYGIIPAAIEQARIAAANMVAPGSVAYSGTVPSTTLKVAGAELTSLGECLAEGDEYDLLRSVEVANGRYRKLVLYRGRIVGAILINEPAAARSVSRLIESELEVTPWRDLLLRDDFDLSTLLQRPLPGGHLSGGRDVPSASHK